MTPTFWKSPRKSRIRWWLWQLHFWGGLAAGLVWAVVGLTGSLLVFVPELRRVEAPGWSRVQPAGSPLPIETLTAIVLKQRPGDRLFSIYWDFKADWGLNIRTVAPNGGRIHNFVDQYRGAPLGSVDYNHSPLQWFYDLHADLLGAETGRKVNACLAAALFLAALTGLLLWWRGRKNWKLGLEYRSKASWKRQAWDLHNLGGFAFSLPFARSCRHPSL